MELIDIVIHLPWPPTVNNYYTKVRNGLYISKRGRKYREQVEEAVREQSINKIDALHQRLCVKIVLYPPDIKVRDLDNYHKSLLDAVTKAEVWRDDSLIDQLFTFRGREIKKGKAVMMISDANMIIPANSEHIIKEL